MHPEPVRFGAGQAEEVIAAIGDALADAELTVDELTEAIAERTGPWAVERTMDAFGDKWPRWRQLTSTAAHRGVLCFGANAGRKVTYTNPHRWLPGFAPADGDTALATLLTRYLYAYGPATPQHFAKWLAIPPRRASELFDALAGFVVAGQPRELPSPTAHPPATSATSSRTTPEPTAPRPLRDSDLWRPGVTMPVHR
jgi:winged helix DNA-binding protein